MRIEQVHISPASHQHFVDEFLDRWKLRPYDNPDEPALFGDCILIGMRYIIKKKIHHMT